MLTFRVKFPQYIDAEGDYCEERDGQWYKMGERPKVAVRFVYELTANHEIGSGHGKPTVIRLKKGASLAKAWYDGLTYAGGGCMKGENPYGEYEPE